MAGIKDFSCVGGLEKHIRIVKEMVLFPLIYGDIYAKFNLRPPRGLLFYGPPGTGKTLVASALAVECSNSERKVSFISRKGSDCLSKWVGESEKKLQKIFQMAQQSRPCIIFFDEVDGLAPVRSSRQDFVHASIVSTLLALMDGLDNNSEIIVIGATNRLDAIDPALRRPGRFDRELYFPLPCFTARKDILLIHVKNWKQKPPQKFLTYLASITVGFCGSDLQALCTEAVMCCVRRNYPQIYTTKSKYHINERLLKIEKLDFIKAQQNIVPASHRVYIAPVKTLSTEIRPLLENILNHIMTNLYNICPTEMITSEDSAIKTLHSTNCPRILLYGIDDCHTRHIGPAILHTLEHLPCHILDVTTLFEETGRAAEESIIQKVKAARHTLPSLLYIPDILSWWELVDEAARVVFTSLLRGLDQSVHILILITAKCDRENIPLEISILFNKHQGEIQEIPIPNAIERENYFYELFLKANSTSDSISNKSCNGEIIESIPVKKIKMESKARTKRNAVSGTLKKSRSDTHIVKLHHNSSATFLRHLNSAAVTMTNIGISSTGSVINNGSSKREHRSACGEGPLVKRQRLVSSNGNSLKSTSNPERLNETQLQRILHRTIWLTEGWPCHQLECLRASLEWILDSQESDIYEPIDKCLADFEHGISSDRPKNELKLEQTVEMAEDAVSGSGVGSAGSCSGSNSGGGSISGETSRLQLLQEMRKQNFDSIRFASYRTACKMRFIQKKVNLHNVDIWNVIEAFRENSLNTLEPSSTLSVSRLETLLSSLFHALNKRVPISQQAKVDATTALLMNWLLAAYTSGDNNKISVFSVKVALATLCAGKLMDKFRYIYSQISDGNGHMIHWRFTEYLKEVLALPGALYESPSFGYSSDLANSIFASNTKITVNDFLDTLMSEPGPHCLIWLPLYHRMASVEYVIHPIACDACHRENFSGFRYRCQRCHSYQLCQDCFWRGKVSGTHNNDHETREYSSFKSPSKQIGHSLRKSFRCVPDKGRNNLPRFPEQPEKTLDLSHIVPPSPLPSHNGFPDSGFMAPFDSGSLDSRSTLRSSRLDDEHKLIAIYAQRLSQETRTVPRTSSRLSQVNQTSRTPSDTNLTSLDASRAQRELISQLEAKNKEIMREIARLRRQQEIEAAGIENPALMSELRALRQRKDELENHLATLQDSRRQLMVQLEGLMKMLKIHQASPRSTPNSSPRSTKSPPLLPGSTSSKSAPPTPGGSLSIMPNHQQQQQQMQQQMSRSYQSPIPPTPMSVNIQTATNASIHSSIQNTSMPDNLSCVGGDVRSAFRTNSLPGSSFNSTNNSLGRSLRNDLLIAADNVTNAMSSLVRELNSDSDEEDQLHNSGHYNIKKPLDFEIGEDDEGTNDTSNWREELQRRYQQENDFLSELRACNNIAAIQSHSHQQNQHHNQQTSNIQYSNQNPNQNQHQIQTQNQVEHQNHNTNNYNQNNEQEKDNYQQHQNEFEEAEDEKRNESEIEWSEAVKRWINR